MTQHTHHCSCVVHLLELLCIINWWCVLLHSFQSIFMHIVHAIFITRRNSSFVANSYEQLQINCYDTTVPMPCISRIVQRIIVCNLTIMTKTWLHKLVIALLGLPKFHTLLSTTSQLIFIKFILILQSNFNHIDYLFWSRVILVPTRHPPTQIHHTNLSTFISICNCLNTIAQYLPTCNTRHSQLCY